MSISDYSFRRLQKRWYNILANHLGFEDIEELKGNDFTLKEYSFRTFDDLSSNIKENYFRVMAQMVHDSETVFRNEIDKFILNRHVEGAKIKTIMEELLSLGSSRDRKSIRFIIRRYEVKWGVKAYKPSQLGIQER